MKLEAVKIKNFRCYEEEFSISFENMTTLVGRNDAGKSTVLEALEIFFNNKTVKLDKEDVSVGSSTTDVEITCMFSGDSENIVIDSTYSTSLSQEYLLNQDSLLEIKKVYSCTSSTIKEKTYIICNHPNKDGLSDLLLLSQPKLKARASSLGVDESTYNKTINTEIRKAIWNSEQNLDIRKTEIPVDKEDTKKIYESLKKYLPIYNLFQSDRSSNDSDSEVTEPMKVAVQNAISEAKDKIEEIKELVRREALETANRTLVKLAEMNPDLASELTPEFKSEPNFSTLFKLSINSDNNIPINKRGSGVRRLILINFFRAEAEKRLNTSVQKSIIYAFEEPETSQHPNHQHMLLDSLMDLSEANNTQVIMTTHTPPIAKRVPLTGLRLIEVNDSGKKEVYLNDDSVYQKIVDYLGVYPEEIPKGCKAFLFVEGVGDVHFVNHTSEELAKNGHIDGSLEDNGITAIPIGGCNNLKFWVEYKLAEKYEIPYFVLLDSDLGTTEERKQRERIESLEKSGIMAKTTRKRELENYLHKDVTTIEVSDFEDAKVLIGEKTDTKKSKVLNHFWPMMTSELIREVEKYDIEGVTHYEFSEFFEEIIRRTKSYNRQTVSVSS